MFDIISSHGHNFLTQPLLVDNNGRAGLPSSIHPHTSVLLLAVPLLIVIIVSIAVVVERDEEGTKILFFISKLKFIYSFSSPRLAI